MSVLFPGQTTPLTRGTGLPTQHAFTFAKWVKLAAQKSGAQIIWSLDLSQATWVGELYHNGSTVDGGINDLAYYNDVDNGHVGLGASTTNWNFVVVTADTTGGIVYVWNNDRSLGALTRTAFSAGAVVPNTFSVGFETGFGATWGTSGADAGRCEDLVGLDRKVTFAEARAWYERGVVPYRPKIWLPSRAGKPVNGDLVGPDFTLTGTSLVVDSDQPVRAPTREIEDDRIYEVLDAVIGAQTVSPSGAATAEAHGSSSVSVSGTTVSPSGIATAFGAGTLAINQKVVPAGSLLLSASSNGRYLQNAFGEPFFVNGDAAWSLISQCTPTEVTTYLDDRKARGVTAIIVELIDTTYNDSPPGNYNGDQPFTTPGNFSTPNDVYFNWAKSVIQAAAARGIVVFLWVAYIGFDSTQGWLETMEADTLGHLRTYGQYVGRLLKEVDNVVIVGGGDRLLTPTDFQNHSQTTTEIIHGYRDVNTRHLVSAHWQRPTISTDASDAEATVDWLTVNGIYENIGVTGRTKNAWDHAAGLPAIGLEFYYTDRGSISGHTITRADVREFFYSTWLGGATSGAFSGREKIWPFGATFTGAPFPAENWHADLGNADDAMLAPITTLVQGRAWHDLVPDFSSALVTAGRGTFDTLGYVTATKTADGKLAIVYLPTGAGTITVAVSQMTGGATVRARWMNPTSGAFTEATSSPFAASGSKTFSSPFTHSDGSTDAVLVLETAGHQLNLGLAPNGATSAEAHGSSTLTPGSVTVSPSGAATGEAEGTPTVTLGAQVVSPSGVATAEAEGTPQLNQQINPSGATTAETHGSTTVSPGSVTVSPSGIATGEAEGTHQVNLAVAPSGASSAEAPGTATVTPGGISVSPTGAATSETHGSATVSAGGATVSPPGATSGEAAGAPQLNLTETLAGIASAEAHGSSQANQAIAPPGKTSDEAIGDPVVNSGSTTVQPQGTSSAEAFGSGAVVPGSVQVAPSGAASGETIGSHVIGQGAITVSPSGASSAESVGAAALTSGQVTVSPSGASTGEAIGAAVVVPSGVAVSPSGVVTGEATGAAQVNQNVAPSGAASGEAPGAPALASSIAPSGAASSEAHGETTVAGSGAIAVPSVASGEAVPDPTVQPGAVTVNPTGVASGEAFGLAAIIRLLIALLTAPRSIFKPPTKNQRPRSKFK